MRLALGLVAREHRRHSDGAVDAEIGRLLLEREPYKVNQQAVIDACAEKEAPVFLQVSQGAIKYASLEIASGIVKASAEAASVPHS